jgi:hypothetical protein
MVGVAWAVVWFFWFRNTPLEKRDIPPFELSEIRAMPKSDGDRFNYASAVRTGNFWAILLMSLGYGYGFYSFVAWLPTYLEQPRCRGGPHK